MTPALTPPATTGQPGPPGQTAVAEGAAADPVPDAAEEAEVTPPGLPLAPALALGCGMTVAVWIVVRGHPGPKQPADEDPPGAAAEDAGPGALAGPELVACCLAKDGSGADAGDEALVVGLGCF